MASPASSEPSDSGDGNRVSPAVMERYRAKLRRLEESRQKGSPRAGLSSEVSRDPEPIVKMWLMDTGCGHDLITKSDAQRMKQFIRRASTA
eukprot:8874630-Lingulodinium_polyedra.AAC.1